MAYWFAVPGAVDPQGYSRSGSPPAAAYSHSASLGRNPPSQMQKAYASYQFKQSMGRPSWLPGVLVHVELYPQNWRFASFAPISALSDASQPVSLPAPAGGVNRAPRFQPFTTCRNRPTVTRSLSSLKSLTVARSVSLEGPNPSLRYER